MILDSLKNCEKYYPLHSDFIKAFAFIKEYKQNPKEIGKYEIDGDNVYALVMDCELKDEGRLETHKKYIDIQYIFEGTEIMVYANLDNMTVNEDLSEEKDVIFYNKTEKSSILKFYTDDFAIYFPEDGHEPCITNNGAKTIKKIVVKVKL